MPVTRCPHCRTELEIDDADFGYRVQCPACQSAFTPEAESNAPPPPPPPAESARGAGSDSPESARGAGSDTADDGTKVVTCPECNGKVGVLEADLGHDMRCPLCDKVFTATLGGLPPQARRRDDSDEPSWRRSRSGDLPRYDDDRYDRPRRSRYDDEDEYDRPRRRRRSRYDDDSPDELVANAKRECAASGVGMIIIACWGFVFGLLGIALYAAIIGGAFPVGGGPAGGGMPEWQMYFNMAVCVLQLFTSGFLLYGGLQMRQAKQYGLCMVALIISMVPYFSPCCILGLIFGIMGLVKLSDTRVKRGFDANKPDYQGDGYN